MDIMLIYSVTIIRGLEFVNRNLGFSYLGLVQHSLWLD